MSGETIEVDVAVAGGGLVGPALALALARAGLRTAVIDRLPLETRADPGFDGRAYAIALGSARVLGALGLWPALERSAQPIRDIRVCEGPPRQPPAGLHFDPRAIDEGRVGWILEDRHLRGALLAAMAEAPGLAHIGGTAVAGLAAEAGRTRLTLESGATVSASLAVAADGRRSPVAALGGIGYQALAYRQSGLVAAIEHEAEHAGIAHQSFFPGGPFAVLPLPGRRSAIVWSEELRRAEALMALSDADYTAELARRIGPRLGRIALAAARRSHPLSLTLADSYTAPRLALAGDAAHGVHPIAGQGLNMGLRDVAALAEVLLEAGRRGEDIGALDVLRRYERWRRFDNTAFALGMDGLTRLFSNANPLLGALRATGLGLVERLPQAKRGFMREAAGLAGTLPRMLRGQQP